MLASSGNLHLIFRSRSEHFRDRTEAPLPLRSRSCTHFLVREYMSITQDYASTGWLQAFMGIQDPALQQHRLFTKKHLDWLDSLSSLTTIREKADSLDDALSGLWAYCEKNGILWCLKQIPASNVDWVLPSTEDFTIQCQTPPEIDSPQQWGAALGIRDWQTRVTMRILRSDFATWQRTSARVGSGAPVGFTMATSEANMMELDCTAYWTANQWVDGAWKIEIDGQPYMKFEVEEAIQVVRPEVETSLEAIVMAIADADSKLRASKTSSIAFPTSFPAWIPSGDRLVPLHEAVYGGKHEVSVSRAFQSTWDAVWPILYCRRKKLVRGHCEMKLIRSQLDQAFQTEPTLTTWMFVFGELLCQTYLGDGLGICAKYQ